MVTIVSACKILPTYILVRNETYIPNLRICKLIAIFKRSTFLNWENSGLDFISCIFVNSETYVMNSLNSSKGITLPALCSVIIIDSAHTDRQLDESGVNGAVHSTGSSSQSD